MPARTNSCAICRKKRIKCDATLPECHMCIKFGRKCPGPTNGPIIVDMTETAKLVSKKKSKAKRDGSQVVVELFPQEILTGMTIQISQRNAMNEVFYGHFLAYFTTTGESNDIRNRQTWLHRLPDLSVDGSNAALNLALQATASAFSSMKTMNPSLLRDACNLYWKALANHSHVLRTKREITVHTVSTSVLLSLFEAMNATTARAYREHINGAAELIRLAGPGQCIYGVLCQVFFHIRTQMAFVYLTTRQEDKNSVCAEEILRGTLSYDRLPIFQRLIGHITKLTSIYLDLDDNDDGMQLAQLLYLDEYLRIKGEVDALWVEYEQAAEDQGESLFWTALDGVTEYRDSYTALCIAYFASARVLFSVLSPRLAVSFLDLRDHHQRILDVAGYLTTFKIGCAFMRMATPLYLVAMHAEKEEQRIEATMIFERWKMCGLGGISAMALESIHRRKRSRMDEVDAGLVF